MVKGNHLNSTGTGTAMEKIQTEDSERSTEEIRQHIAATRESITDTVDRLNDRFQETFDWRTYVTRHPMVAVGVAAGLGLLISAIFRPRQTPMERMKGALADSLEEFTDHLRSQFDGIAQRPGLSQTVKAAATGLAVKAASDFFANQFSSTSEERPKDSMTAAHPNEVSRAAASDY